MSYETTVAGLGIQRTGTDATSTAKLGQRSLGQEDFLALMTAQMKNQDPFKPVDNTQMVAQMAQFSSLAGITEMSTTMKAIADKLGASTPADALSWVGKTVLTEGATAYPRTDGGVTGAVELDGDASAVDLTIKDAAGTVVRQVAMGAQGKGAVGYDWDGTTDSGAPAGSGPFTITAKATGADGKAAAARNLVWAPVTSVTLTDGQPVLNVTGVGHIAPSAIRQAA
ncbi:flagellar hook assembly protein FlgD [Sphingomonas sp. Leaf25]|uniref:flagellar hook assembly protein FlgD n=1 Tax=Sphingomonas sp. Leaf25 TaxID=1735692 RepID=UPI0006FD25B1|nr:flagellar hook capping FlgD N-terminal domain-containing protein [Sphingomonas sp. Leaf25]KQM96784.1 flagellar hook capping protein [Sphingomonas sp. Leaf25]